MMLDEQRHELALEVGDVLHDPAPDEIAVPERRYVAPHGSTGVQEIVLDADRPGRGTDPGVMIPAEMATKPPWQMMPMGLRASKRPATRLVTDA